MPITFQRVAVPPMRAVVAGAIRSAIMAGGLRPGERLVERALVAQFGASLSVIREALVQLETEGFVMKQRNTATYVTQISLEDAGKMFDLRALLEPFAAGQAARAATPEAVAELREIHTRMCGHAAAGDLVAYLREDYGWHDRIWQLANNEYIRAALARTITPSFALFAIRCPTPPFDMVQDAAEHLEILEAIARKDAGAAGSLLRQSLDGWRKRPVFYAGPEPEEKVKPIC